MEGWLSVYRQLLDNPIVCKDSDYLAVWMYLLLNATHKNMKTVFEGKKITLKPGQLITGRKAIHEKFENISESKIQRILKKFEIEQQIEQRTTTKNRLITIKNWNKYQVSEQQNEQLANNKRTTNEQQVNTNNNVNNDNNIYLYLFNKYRVENRQNFSEYMKKTRELRNDEKWDLLTKEEQVKIISEI